MLRPLFQRLLDRQVHRAGDGIALQDPAADLQLTWRELASRSRQLARELAEEGIHTEARVGVLLPSGVDRIVAMLAILRAGAAFVPIDQEAPQKHLDVLLADAALDLLITDREGTQRKFEASGPPHFLIGWGQSNIPGGQGPPYRRNRQGPPYGKTASGTRGGDLPLPTYPRQSAAYVIYTSGTSGRPKGVVVSHGALASYLSAGISAYGLKPGDRIPQLSTISFDFSICEIFLSLASGATLVLARKKEPLSVDELCHQGRLLRLSVFFLPTALWQELARSLGDTTLPASLRLVSFGGEKVAAPMVQRWRRIVGQRVTLWNGYGPTEATVETTLELLSASGEEPAPDLIGRPLPGVRAKVFDSRLRWLPAGELGELCLAGDCLARGYLGRPATTARSFVPNPQADLPGQRLYRTGDVVRQRPDGRLEILGRTDLQIKVRGFRVEPQEIEARLLEHPAVQSAVVVAPKLPTGGRLLLACIIPTSRLLPDAAPQGGTGILGVGQADGQASGQELRTFLARRLPAHLVPAQFQIRQAFPLTAHGKVDRRALEQAVTRTRPRVEPKESPRDASEALLAAVWAEILDLPRVGIEQNFFELGGDSILALRVVTRARRRGLLFRARDLFDHPTIARLARVAVRRAEAPPLELPAADEAEIPLTPVARWFFEDSRLADPQHFNQSMLVRTPPLDPTLLDQATAALVAHHEALRLSFTRTANGRTANGRTANGWHQHLRPPGDPTPAHTLDLQALPSHRLRAALEAAAGQVQTSLRLRQGPLLRAVAFHLPNGEARLLIAAHHLVVDGVTWAILLGDLEQALHHLAAGRPPRLAPVPVPFRHWAFLQQRVANNPAWAQQLSYWLDRPRQASPLPLDHPIDRRRENTRASHFRVAVGLDHRRTHNLLRRLPAVWGTRIDEVLLTAVLRTLAPWTGCRQLLIDLEGHGREEIVPGLDLSRTVGWFTTTFPVQLTLPVSKEPSVQLRTIKEAMRRIPQHGIGYGLLRYLGTDAATARRLRQLPAPELSFNYLGRLDALFLGRDPQEQPFLAPADESRGLERTRRGHRDYVLEIDGGVVGNRLWINLHGSRSLHRPATLEHLAHRLRHELELLIDTCLEPGAGGYTPSDFPRAGLEADELDRLLGTGQRTVEDLYPLSPMQQGMLFHRLAAPHSGVYFEQSSWQLEGPLERHVFRLAWRRLMERHPVLRTTFAWQDVESPLQIVHRNPALPFVLVDLTEIPADSHEKALEHLLAGDRQRRPGAGQQTLWRITLVALGPQRHRFVWSYDHALVDGWSLALLFEELFNTMEALLRQRQPQAPPTAFFRDYIAWLNQHNPASDVDFWRRQLAGFSSPTTLPFDHLRPAPASRPGAALNVPWDIHRALSPLFTTALEAFGRDHRLTTSTLVQAAWALLLARGAGVGEVLFGTTVSGRPAELEGAETMIGLLIQTLPIRLSVPPQQEGLAWLEDVQRRTVRAREHQALPLVEIQRCAPLLAEGPLFHSLVVFENYPVDGAALEADQSRGALRVGAFRGFSRTSYPLTLGAIPGNRLTLGLSAHRRHFESTTAQRLVLQVERLLTALVATPTRRLGEFDLLSSVERHQLLCEWNDTASSGQTATSPFALFLHQRQLQPHAPAVHSPAQASVLTYETLARSATHQAAQLRRLGVGTEERVALLLPQGIERVVIMLAVLATGAAYVPLDPAYPPGRLRLMLGQSSSRRLLTSAPLEPLARQLTARAELADEPLVKVTVLQPACRATVLPLSPEQHQEPPPPESAAYVLFTSGSSGVPKGVVVSHRALAWYCVACRHHYGLLPADKVLQLASISFDISVGEIFPSLASGATLVLYDDTFRGSVGHFYRRMQEMRISILLPPTAFWHELAAEPESAAHLPSSLRLLSFGGESLHFESLESWQQTVGPRVRLLTGYGPTEATVEATVHPLAQGAEAAPSLGTSPLGRPIDAVRVHLLDGQLRSVPRGAEGEIHLAGPGLARGYQNRPAQTAAAFLPDPTTTTPGGRLYATGDLGVFDHQGRLFLVGRRDRQVKVGGLRVEPGEVENALRRLPEARQAAVVAVRMASETGHRLVAFLVAHNPDSSRQQLDAALRQALRQRLPPPLLPSAFHWLPHLPLSPAGKIDYRELEQRALTPQRPQDTPPALTSPTTSYQPIVEILKDVWGRVLRRPALDATADFFELGGHSLLATRLISHLRKAFGVEIPLRLLFDHPTPRSFASALRAVLEAGSEEVPPPLLPRPSTKVRLPLSFAQHRLWIQEQLHPGDAAWHMADAWRLRGRLKVPSLAAALTALVARHEALRTTFRVSAGHPWQVIGAALSTSLPQVDLEALPPQRREAVARALLLATARRPFELAEGPLLRLLLLHLGPQEAIFLRVLHHIAGDAWSDGVFYRELSQAYSGNPLPALPVQPADFARWQRRYLAAGLEQRLQTFWHDTLDGAQELDLPTDRPPSEYQRGSLDRLLPKTCNAPFEALAVSSSATRFMVFLAAFSTLLERWTGAPEVVVGTPTHGREHRSAEGLVGCFVNSLVLRLPAPRAAQGFRRVLEDVRRTCLAAYAHQELPFDRLVEALRPPRRGGRNPFFEVIVEHVVGDPAQLEFPGVTAEALDTGGGHGPWALSLDLLYQDDGWRLDLEYDASRFDSTTVHRLLVGLETLLQGGLTQPDRPLAELPYSSPAEAHQLRMEWPWSRGFNSSNVLFPELLGQRAAERPQAIAFVDAQSRYLSYGTLLRRVRALAQHLRKRGVGAEARVGLLATRESETLVCVLAILTAGGAYVPLQPSASRGVQASILDAAAARWLLGESSTALVELAEVSGTCLIDPRVGPHQAEESPPSGHPRAMSPNQLAYVIATSGSSGRPQAVGVEHRSLAWYSQVAAQNYGLHCQDHVLQFAPLTFDISVEEIFPTLAAGATLVLRDEEALGSARAFWAFCARHAISLACLSTAFWHRLAQEVKSAPPPPSLQRLAFGGEAVRPDLLTRWQEVSAIPIFDTYGPTETTVVATLERVGQAPPGLGRPLVGVRAQVLDSALHTVPAGTPGELMLSGEGLARGYLGSATATASRFVPDPHATVAGNRLYRTGDAMRWLADGRLQFLGRLDRETKIRGYRVDPRAVESALQNHPDLREAVVEVRSGLEGGRRLVAWLVADAARPSIPTLRSFLRARLSDWMVPTSWNFLEELPLNRHGKVDRHALSTLQPSSPQISSSLPGKHGDSTATAPRNSIETILLAAFGQALGQPQVGIHDDFFALGGDSILAIRVAALAQQQGLQLNPGTLLQHPTVALVAQTPLLTAQVAAPEADREDRADRSDIPLTPIQRWFFAWSNPRPHHFNQSYLLRLERRLPPWILERAVDQLMQAHGALRLRFEQRAGAWRQFMAQTTTPLPTITLDLARLPEHLTARALQAVTRQVQGSLHLRRGPLLRLASLHLPGDGSGSPWRLLLVVHHLAVDGVSWPVLLEDLELFCRQTEAGHAPVAQASSTSYRAWAEGLTQYATSGALDLEVPYWLDVLQQRQELPADQPPKNNHHVLATQLTITLSATSTGRFLKRSAHCGVRPDALLLTALVLAFETYTHKRALLVEVEDHGRTDLLPGLDLSRTVGWFTATYPISLELPPVDDAVHRLRAINRALLGVPNRGLGFGMLRFLSPETPEISRLRKLPPPEVSFNYLGRLDPTLAASTLFRVAPESAGPDQGHPGAPTHKFDINCRVEGGSLVADWSYCPTLYHRETVQRLARQWLVEIERLADSEDSQARAIRLPASALR